MALPFENHYLHRRVAESASKPCSICYRPATSVLITPDQADWFYVCTSHLSDRGFATKNGPSKEELERRRKEELQKEVERVKREWEEKERRRKEKGKEKEKEGDKKEGDKKEDDGDKEKKKKKDGSGGEESGKEGGDEKKKEEEGEEGAGAEKKSSSSGPESYTLNKKIYDMRINRLRQQQQAKRNMELLKSASLSVPKGGPV